jgi:hypothetical protein
MFVAPYNFIFIFFTTFVWNVFNSGRHLNSPAAINLELAAEKVQIFM